MKSTPHFLQNWIIVHQFKRLIRRINSLTNVNDVYANNAVSLEKKVLEDQIEHKLANTPAEALKKYHTGARLQPLSNYSIKDVDRMSAKRLANIRGIGSKSAYSIRDCTDAFVKETRENERLNLSNNNQTTNTSDLIKNLFIYDKLNGLAEEGQFISDQGLKDKDLIKKARVAVHPILWLFSSNKDSALNSINEIQQLLSSPLVTEVQELEDRRSDILKVEHDTYWRSFCDDPARYYSLLEECKSLKNRKRDKSEGRSYLDIFDPNLRRQIENVDINTNGLKCILRPYQKFGVKYILNQVNVLLGDEMGLGKTIEAIATIVSLRNNGETHFVVICPASVLVNWEREISRHSDLKGYVLHGPGFQNNLKMWAANGGIAITNYENTSRFHYDDNIALAVVDEAHYIKNYGAARTRNTVNILKNSKRRLLMSGTPLENKLDEMVALINLLQPEIVEKIYSLPQPINQYSFKCTVAPVYFRRTKDSVWREMPDLQIVEDVVELTSAERQLYIKCVEQRDMKAFTKMRQVSFIVENESDSSKLHRIKEICEEAFENKRKVLVFSFYLDTIERIRKYLEDAVYGPITGSISPQKRQQIIDSFSSHEGGAVLLSQILAGGTGLNIQKASIVIMCEPQYKPSTENQAIARAYRIGQTSKVTVYRLLGEKTVDERILQILKEKQAVFDAYANKSEIGEQSIRLNEADLAELEFNNTNIN